MAPSLHADERIAMKAHFYALFRCMAQIAAAFGLALGLSGSAYAIDGCKLLLCLAGNWQSISQCRPDVEQAMRDVARGRGWPECGMGGDSGTRNTDIAPELCPLQYRTEVQLESGVMYACPYSGVVDAVVAGQPWSRTWWAGNGDSVTEWLPAAKAQFANDPGAMDDRFDRDLAAWLASQLPAPAPGGEPTGGGN